MTSKDNQGREYVKLREFVKLNLLFEGQIVEVDAGFDCIPPGRHEVKAALYIDCKEGRHYLEPNVNEAGYVVGLYWPRPTYKKGDQVWLKKFDNGTVVQPRQQATITSVEDNLMYTGKVEPQEPDDDGLREFDESQIEGLVEEKVETGA